MLPESESAPRYVDRPRTLEQRQRNSGLTGREHRKTLDAQSTRLVGCQVHAYRAAAAAAVRAGWTSNRPSMISAFESETLSTSAIPDQTITLGTRDANFSNARNLLIARGKFRGVAQTERVDEGQWCAEHVSMFLSKSVPCQYFTSSLFAASPVPANAIAHRDIEAVHGFHRVKQF